MVKSSIFYFWIMPDWKTIIVIITIFQNLSTSYQQVIHIIHIFNNHNTKLSTLYPNLSTLQNIANTTTIYSYPHYIIKLSTPSHIVFNTTSFRSAIHNIIYKVFCQISQYTRFYYKAKNFIFFMIFYWQIKQFTL